MQLPSGNLWNRIYTFRFGEKDHLQFEELFPERVGRGGVTGAASPAKCAVHRELSQLLDENRQFDGSWC